MSFYFVIVRKLLENVNQTIFIVDKLYHLICARDIHDTAIDFPYLIFIKLFIRENITQIKRVSFTIQINSL